MKRIRRLAAAKRWNTKDGDPISDIKRWRKKVQETGFVNCNICIMADNVADVFVNNEKVKALLDVKAYDLAVIKPQELPDGVTYVGTLRGLGLDLYTYNEWFLDDWTNPESPENKPLVPEGTIALELLNKGVIGKQFTLRKPLEYVVYPDETGVYYLGEMITIWGIPTIKREVNLYD